MKSFLKMFSVVSLLGAALVFSGCGGGGSDGFYAVTPGTPGTPGSPLDVVVDGKGTIVPDAPETFAATGSARKIKDNAAIANNAIITGFSATDSIEITGATSAQYDSAISSLPNGDVIFEYNNGSAVNRIVVKGAIPAPVGSQFVSSVASFNALAVGDITFK